MQVNQKSKEDYHDKNCKHSDVKCVYEGWESETYECQKCGFRYKLYDEDMK